MLSLPMVFAKTDTPTATGSFRPVHLATQQREETEVQLIVAADC